MNERIQSSRAFSPWRYLSLLLGVSALLIIFFGIRRLHGCYIYPPGFTLFTGLFALQYGLFGSALLATLLYLFHRLRVPGFAAKLILGLFFFCFVWMILWGLVQRAFGIELTPALIFDVFTNRAPVSEMGVNATEFSLTIVISLALIIALVAITGALTSQTGLSMRRRVCLVFVGLFLLVNIPVRAYFRHQTARHDYAALECDDCVPFSLQTERLISAMHDERIALSRDDSLARTRQYVDFLRNLRPPSIPRKQNILWINVESLRFDAVDESAMPHLWAYRNRFQIRLNQQHWSEANKTHIAVFSMLTGLSGNHFLALRQAGISDPFLKLLQDNGYHLRIGKKAHIDSTNLFELLPRGTVCEEIDPRINGGDSLMVDSYLRDRRGRQAGRPAFDFLAFDATHFPYAFPEKDAVFQPAPQINASKQLLHSLHSGDDIVAIHNRYRNSCHFVDGEIGRVLDDLAAAGDFDDTIVVVVGDHGEEFQERGQITHSGVLNDYQGRTVLWMHIPGLPPDQIHIDQPTLHRDIVPTVLESLGFSEDVLYTQGHSLLGPLEKRPMISLCEQGGLSFPLFRDFVTARYISRWRYTPARYLLAGVQKRDGQPVENEEWLREVRALYQQAEETCDMLPITSRPPHKFAQQNGPALLFTGH